MEQRLGYTLDEEELEYHPVLGIYSASNATYAQARCHVVKVHAFYLPKQGIAFSKYHGHGPIVHNRVRHPLPDHLVQAPNELSPQNSTTRTTSSCVRSNLV